MQTFQGYDALAGFSLFMILHPKKSTPCSTVCQQRPSPIQRAASLSLRRPSGFSRSCVRRMCGCHEGGFLGQHKSDDPLPPRRHLRRILCHPHKLCTGSQPLRRAELHCTLLKRRKMMTLCSRACEFHNQLTRNLLSVLAERNFQLGQKLEHMPKRTTRENSPICRVKHADPEVCLLIFP